MPESSGAIWGGMGFVRWKATLPSLPFSDFPMTRRLSLLLLVGCVCALSIARGATRNVPFASAEATNSSAADSLLLDQYPDAYAAYSLRKLRSDYNGPAIRVRRTSDSAEQDFGFTSEGNLDVIAIENWLSGSDGEVVTWYSQVFGTPNMSAAGAPEIAQGGTVITDSDGDPTIQISTAGSEGFSASGLSIPYDDWSLSVVGEITGSDGNSRGLYYPDGPGFTNVGAPENDELSVFYEDVDGTFNQSDNISVPWQEAIYTIHFSSSEVEIWLNDESVWSQPTGANTGTTTNFTLFYRGDTNGGVTGQVSEVFMYPSFSSDQELYDRYDNANSYWSVGPTGTNREAVLPQRTDWQVTLYDWLETLSEEDVTLPNGTISWDGTYADNDELADLWLKVKGLSASSSTRSHPGWYVLDNGNGKGIEATGSVKIPHDPKGNGDYAGNPPRSWANEPALLYDTSIPLSGGGEGNPWYGEPAMARRALVIAAVDMMMHQAENGFSNWTDMHGKAMLSWAEVYRWCKSELPSEVQTAFEKGIEHSLDLIIDRGARAVNTNMDMFAMQGAADFYMATNDTALQNKAVDAVRKTLLGDVDATVDGPKHEVFAVAGRQGGVFDPSGFIMEGGQPDIFYMGESMYHLLGALQAVKDRSTGSVPSEWAFLETVTQRIQEWMTYQMFYDPHVLSSNLESDENLIQAGAGFAGRTGAGVPSGQADYVWKKFAIADISDEYAFIPTLGNIGPSGEIPTPSNMEASINNKLSYIDGEMSNTYSNGPDDWSGWSPWTKATPYLPPEGWYSNLKSLADKNDPKIENVPAARDGVTWNKTFGGPATNGGQYWSYKQTDANGEPWGFFVEAQAKQGTYGGWYGGKIETFWSESTGVVLLNRHGKTGCDGSNEDSVCWNNLDEKAGHHVWGRDENGNGFTTLLLRGREISRTSTFDTDGSPPTVTVNNIFNDGTNKKPGEETGSEIEGSFEVENKFETQSNGLKVTHSLSSDQTDDVKELWASLPVFLRSYNPERAGDDAQGQMDDTSIEYWDGASWSAVPEDQDSDGVPEIVTTDALRLGRDYQDGKGIQYAYVSFASNQDLRLSLEKYYDPYQTKTGVRTVHIDLHGNPGTTKTLPASKSVSYTIQTTEPALGALFTEQDVSLRKGSNLISAALAPEHAHMDSVFAGVAADVVEVKNEAGERYRPADGVNEIGHWDRDEAYVVYAESGATLSLQGTPVDTSSIALDEGWNWVPYSRSSALAVEEALTSIQDVLVMVKDEAGRAYVPGEGIEELSTLTPGEGYRVYVSSSTTLTYPAGSN